MQNFSAEVRMNESYTLFSLHVYKPYNYHSNTSALQF